MTKLALVLEDFTSKLNNLKSKSENLISKIDPEFSKECDECKEIIEDINILSERIKTDVIKSIDKRTKQLKESEEKYRLISEDSDDLIAIYDENFNIEYMNESTHSRILGYNPLKLRKKYFRYAIIHKDDFGEFAKVFREGYNKGKFRHHFRLKHQNGHFLWFEVRGKTFFDKQGKKKILVMSRDITGIKKAEQELKKLNFELEKKVEERTRELKNFEEFYKAILDGIINGVWVSNKDDKIFYANKGMEAIAGITVNQIVGVGVLKDFPESTLKYFRPYYQEAKRSLKTVYYETVPVVTPAGRQSFQSGWLIPRINNGNYDGIICTVEDVTERKNYEEQLRESKKQLAKFNKELELKVEEKTKALKESERRYKDERDNLLNILNSMEDGVYIINQQYEIEFVNPSLKKNFGPIDNKKCYEYFQNNSEPCSFCKSLEKTENKTNRWEWDSPITQKIYELIVTPLKNLDGSDLRLVIFHDITDRKKAEMALKRSENSYKTLTENLPCLVYRVNVKENNRMDFFNDLLQPMMGYSFGELTHGEVCSIDPIIYPEDKENVVKNVKKAVLENRPFEVEYRLMHKNGCIKWLNERGRPVIGDDGELHSIDGVIFDITDRKKVEEKIRYQAKLVENVSDAIISFDMDFNIMSWNKAAEKIYGWKAHEVMGKNLRGIIPVEFPYENREDVLKDFFERGYWSGEGIQYHKNGTKINVLSSSSIIEDIDENRTGIVTVNRDITESKKAEQKLKESEGRFKYLISSNPAIIYTSEVSGDYGATFISENVKDQMGYTQQNFTEDSEFWINHIHPDDRKRILSGLSELFDRGYLTHEYRFLYKNGTYHWMRDELKIIKDGNGNPIETIGSIIDITESKKAQKVIEEQNKFLTNLIESLTHPFYVINIDDYTIALANSAASFGEIKKNSTCYALTHNLSVPCSEIHQCPLEEMKKTKKPVEVEHIHYDIYDNPRNFEVHGYPIFDNDGNIIQMIEYALDITERKQAEEKLKASEEKYRHLFDSSPNAIFLTKKEGIIIDCNLATEKTFGYSKEEFIGKYYIDLGIFSPDQISYFVKAYKKLRQGIDIKPFELKIRKKDGSLIWVNYLSSMIILDGEILVESIVQDITEKKKAEDMINEEIKKLKELDQIKSEFVDRASHELKTPLNSIYGASTFLLDYYKDYLDDKAKELLEIIKKGGERLIQLIEDLLDVSRLESGKLDLKMQGENIVKIIYECVNDLNYFAERRKIKFNLEIQEDFYLEVDKIRFEQVIDNLISNAIKNTLPNGDIHINLQKHEASVDIIIKDTGVGFTEEEKEKVFKKFGKIERYGKGMDIDTEGSGLGLYISKRIVELHNGKIWIESKGRNQGSKVIVKLPISGDSSILY